MSNFDVNSCCAGPIFIAIIIQLHLSSLELFRFLSTVSTDEIGALLLKCDASQVLRLDAPFLMSTRNH